MVPAAESFESKSNLPASGSRPFQYLEPIMAALAILSAMQIVFVNLVKPNMSTISTWVTSLVQNDCISGVTGLAIILLGFLFQYRLLIFESIQRLIHLPQDVAAVNKNKSDIAGIQTEMKDGFTRIDFELILIKDSHEKDFKDLRASFKDLRAGFKDLKEDLKELKENLNTNLQALTNEVRNNNQQQMTITHIMLQMINENKK